MINDAGWTAPYCTEEVKDTTSFEIQECLNGNKYQKVENNAKTISIHQIDGSCKAYSQEGNFDCINYG